MSISTSASNSHTTADWAHLPTETEIYILADGRVVIADLPAELAPILAQLGQVEPCALNGQDTAQSEQADGQ